MFLSKNYFVYSNYDIAQTENNYHISATFLILKVFKSSHLNSFDKKLIEELSKSFENIQINEPSPNYVETFPELQNFKYTWRDIQCDSREYLTEEEFMNKIYAVYEFFYEKSFIGSFPSPFQA